jgi:hypothetical protein
MRSKKRRAGSAVSDGARGLAVLLMAMCLLGCEAKPRQAAAPSAKQPPAVVDEPVVAVLPNNLALHGNGDRITAYGREGDVAWELVLPYRDRIIAPIAVALNSMAYVRGMKMVHAATADGKWAWSKPLDGPAFMATSATNAPVASPDSTVAMVVADDVVRFGHDGVVRWRMRLPEGHVTATLSPAMDGALYVHTNAALFCITPEGKIAWKRPVGG